MIVPLTTSGRRHVLHSMLFPSDTTYLTFLNTVSCRSSSVSIQCWCGVLFSNVMSLWYLCVSLSPVILQEHCLNRTEYFHGRLREVRRSHTKLEWPGSYCTISICFIKLHRSDNPDSIISRQLDITSWILPERSNVK